MKKFGLFILVLLVSIILFGCKKDEKENNVNFNIILNDYIGIDRTYDLVAVDDNGNSISVEWSIDDDSLAVLEGNKITGESVGLLGIKASYKGNNVEKIVVVDECKTIKYELDGGTCDLLEEEIFKSKTYVLPTPTKEGYVFEGWYSNPTYSGTVVTELNSKNFTINTLYALWHSEKYEIKYVLVKDGVESETKEEDMFTADYNLTNPTYDNNTYIFSGWYLDKRLYEKVDHINAGTKEDITVYGYLQNKDTMIDITYVATDSTYEGGSNKVKVKVGTNTFLTPNRTDYTFLGWYKDSKYQYEADTVYISTSLYAKFKETYPVSEVTITNTETEMARKSTLQLNYSLSPSKVSVSDVTFTSSDPSVATVDEFGNVTGLGWALHQVGINLCPKFKDMDILKTKKLKI